MGILTTVVGRASSDASARAEPNPRDDRRLNQAASTAAGTAAPVVLPVIRSKIEPPSMRDSNVSRQRLLDQLEQATSSRVTLLVAEAGYGKTTLLGDYAARSGIRCLWYRLDSTDRDWITLVNYLIASVREVRPEFGASTTSILTGTPTGDPPRDTVIASFLGELEQLSDTRTVMILDDFHAVDDSPDAGELTARLIKDAPSSFSFVLASRRRPPLLLARLAGMGELAELGTDDLRFSLAETERLFAEGYGQPLDADILSLVDARTEGWAASLQLFHSSTTGRPTSAVRSFARSLSGASGQLYDYLAEEVLTNIPDELAGFLLRSALLTGIVPGQVAALFPPSAEPTAATVAAWFEQAERLGVFSRASSSSEARQLHPLLREFLVRELEHRFDAASVREMHARVARAVEPADPLVACHHYIEANEHAEAMRCLGGSVLLTMGSGRTGYAAELIKRLKGVPADPAVVALQARQLMEEGDLSGAAELMAGVDVGSAPPEARAAFRQTRVSLGWRSGDRDLLFATLNEVAADSETPPVLGDIARMFLDASTSSPSRSSLPALARRLESMAASQALAGHDYYAAISLNNAAIAHWGTGHFTDSLRLAQFALDAFDRLAFDTPDRHATHSVMAACCLELGLVDEAEDYIRLGLSTGRAAADVPAQIAFHLVVIGDNERAEHLLPIAEALQREGRSDLSGAAIIGFTTALLHLPLDPRLALRVIEAVPAETPLDLGVLHQRRLLLALCHLLDGQTDASLSEAIDGGAAAKEDGARRFESRMSVLAALAAQDSYSLRRAISDAAALGELALLELADAIGQSLHIATPAPAELRASIARWPRRWLPVLRRQLERGNTPNARAAALLLDEYGTQQDIGRLRAFDKTYLKRGRGMGVGRALARRVGTPLVINDLGRVRLQVGEHQVPLGRIRRKAASLLMYLVTRPKFTANREQVLDELWPDSRPTSAANSLNQSLYFLRRDIDPWYEDDVSVDYISFEGDLLWLDSALVSSMSAEFLDNARALLVEPIDAHRALALVERYGGQFCPEFEYEEWAISWRMRVHASFLNLAHTGMHRLVEQGDLGAARDVALKALSIDPQAEEIERGLIWIYWHQGASSAATTLHEHLASRDRSDGLSPPSLADVISGDKPH